MGEFGLIGRMRTVLGAPVDEDVRLGIDDDAAVYHVGEGRVHVVTTDALIEGVHFDRSFVP
ncbi:thiamine-phosphate kinase, partial [Weissella cibaria]|nr:thiamine-phosphate kinase [Weissella cibaria]